MKKVPKRIAASIMNSLRGGVVPRIGLGYIAVGREKEINALLDDVEIMEEGGASFRIITGEYGAGKSFLLQTIRTYAMDRGFAVMDCDLSPERRLIGNKGQGLATYRELMGNISVKACPDGGALPAFLEKWIQRISVQLLEEQKQLSPEDTEYDQAMQRAMYMEIAAMESYVQGFDFAKVLLAYWEGFRKQDEELQKASLRWLRGEYHRRSEVPAKLGVSVMISDENWYEYVKLFTEFLVRAGYKGLYILLDEVVNLSKIPNKIARSYNYEKLLLIYNDMLQGRAKHMGFLLSATPACLEDTRRGIFSYDALRSRLEEGRSVQQGVTDLLSPVIHLKPLSSEELFILLERLQQIHADLYDTEELLNEKQRLRWIEWEYDRLGAEEYMTPRELIRDYITLLNILYQNPERTFEELMGPQIPPEEDVWGEFEL